MTIRVFQQLKKHQRYQNQFKSAVLRRRTLWASHRWPMDAEDFNATILLRLSDDFEQLAFVWLVKMDNRRTDTTIVLSHEFGI
jgi:hypothetical protein